MSVLNFAPAKRSEAKARVALLGPTGSGKTHTALAWATVLADGGTVAVIDTENASASLYADEYDFVTSPWWPPYDASRLAAAIKDAASQFDVLVLDSLTHFWAGEGGVLDVVDREAAKNRGNSYTAWKKGSPIWRGLLDALIFAPCHVVVTMRSKMDYILTEDKDGKKKPEKVGMAPQARNDVEYEFTLVAELDQSHNLSVTKSRCSALADAAAPPHQAGGIAKTLRDWLSSADADAAATKKPEPEPEPVVEADPDAVTEAQVRKMAICFRERGIIERGARLGYIGDVVGRTVGSSKELSKKEAGTVIDRLESTPPSTPAADETPPLFEEAR